MIRLRAPFEPVVAAIYGPSVDEREWLSEVRSACLVAFEGCSDVQAITFSVDLEAQRMNLATVVCGAPFEDALRESYALADPRTFKVAINAGSMTLASKAAPTPSLARDRAVAGGVQDLLQLTARPSKLLHVAVSFSFTHPLERIPTPTRQMLRRLAAHLEAAARLRAAAQNAARMPSLLDGSAASTEMHARVKAALEDDLGRASGGEPRAAHLVEFWHGLLSGRYAMVERYESRGRRVVLARVNSPAETASRALSERERLVIERIAAGDRAHQVAHDFGVRESTISAAVARCLRKMGLRHVTELVELHAVLAAGGLSADLIPSGALASPRPSRRA